MVKGGGLYARGANAHITINSGTIQENTVSQYVYNQNVANEGGLVTLNGGNVTHVVITFDANGGNFGSGTPIPAEQKIVTSTNSYLAAPAVSRTGYELTGWNTKPNGTGTGFANENQIMNINTPINLYAQWKSLVTR